MAHMKKTSFRDGSRKDPQQEITNYTGFWTFLSTCCTKRLQPRCPASLIPLSDLNKNCMRSRELGRRAFWKWFPGRRQCLCGHPSCLRLDGAEPGMQLGPQQPLLAFFCPESRAQAICHPDIKAFLLNTCHLLGTGPACNGSQTIDLP